MSITQAQIDEYHAKETERIARSSTRFAQKFGGGLNCFFVFMAMSGVLAVIAILAVATTPLRGSLSTASIILVPLVILAFLWFASLFVFFKPKRALIAVGILFASIALVGLLAGGMNQLMFMAANGLWDAGYRF